MQIPTAPRQRRIAEERRIWQDIVKQVAGAAQEDEGTLRHLGIFHGQALGVAVRVVAEYRVEDAGGTRGGLLAHRMVCLIGTRGALNITYGAVCR
ncbi:hypothetical protein [Candidatus Nitrotoga arctica]|uniref:Uncharacterized protein n=1 Tax=Candidatus Nitrotoga arctica TaxID=453162 RepID=A0ABM8YW89_9PROT|nr:hypothetical protein [Candidatus Nitrotoga arctica]CAG9931715.1 protein of unknown function [Candidatus Nitrotoga arctica]